MKYLLFATFPLINPLFLCLFLYRAYESLSINAAKYTRGNSVRRTKRKRSFATSKLSNNHQQAQIKPGYPNAKGRL